MRCVSRLVFDSEEMLLSLFFNIDRYFIIFVPFLLMRQRFEPRFTLMSVLVLRNLGQSFLGTRRYFSGIVA